MLNNTDQPAVIRTLDLSKQYGASAAAVHALRGVSLEIQRGQRVALLGKSGSGKSTLLNLIAALDAPTGGEIWVAGRELSTMNSAEAARHRLSTVGIVFQAYNLIGSRTALQNVELPMTFAGRRPKDRRAAALHALAEVGLADRVDHRPAELSGGEQQRVALARALINQPDVLLADEPTGNLDSATAAEVVDVLMDHVRRRHTTLILVTHDQQLAGQCADRVLYMKDGQIGDL